MYYYQVSINSGSLTDNKSVEFIVVAYNDIAMGNVSEANKLVVKDLRKPTISNYYQNPPQQVTSKDTLSRWLGNVPYIGNSTYSSDGTPRSCQYDSDDDDYPDTYYPCEHAYGGSNYSGSGYWGNSWGWQPVWSSTTTDRDEFKFDKLSQSSAVSYQNGTNVILNNEYYSTYITFSEPMDTTKMVIAYTEGTKPARFNLKTAWNSSKTQLYLVPVIAAGDVVNQDASFVALIKGLQDMAGNPYEIKYTKLDGTTYTTSNLGFKFTQLNDYLLP